MLKDTSLDQFSLLDEYPSFPLAWYPFAGRTGTLARSKANKKAPGACTEVSELLNESVHRDTHFVHNWLQAQMCNMESSTLELPDNPSAK
ncbi:hypothetical protein SB861_32870 [Paraburkholderia sp. SIMBA_049]